MKIIFLLNLDLKIKSGLFYAIHNRMKINKEQFDCKFYNIIIVDSKPLKILKKVFRKNIYDDYINDYSIVIDDVEYINIKLKNTLIGKLMEKFKVEQFQYIKIIKKLEYEIRNSDLIVSHWGYPHGRIAYFAKKLYKKDYVVYYHGSDINCYTRDDVKKRNKILQTIKEAKNNIFIGKALMEKIINIGYSDKNIKYTSNGVDTDIFNIRNIKREKIVGFVGNLEFVKRAEILPYIFERIYDKDNDVKFVVIGDGKLKDKIKSQCFSKKIPVEFTGKLNSRNVAKYMNEFSVLVLPSKYESWGSVILEANACGVYVVASNAGGIPQVVGTYGTLVENNDKTIVESCANEVINALYKDIDRQKLSSRVADFRWDKICEIEKKFISE